MRTDIFTPSDVLCSGRVQLLHGNGPLSRR
jgi:hypothetical protein